MKSTVLCYNLKGTKKGKKLAMVLGYSGFKICHVEKSEYNIPIGTLAGTIEICDKEEEGRKFSDSEETDFSDEMLILNPASEAMLDRALFLMRKEKVTVSLKAVLTPENQKWTSVRLYEEIRKEHEIMHKKNDEK